MSTASTSVAAGRRLGRGVAAAVDRWAYSPVNYWAGFAVDAVAVVGFLGGALAVGHATPWAAVATVALGYLAWTLWEYNVHRFLFHRRWSPFARGHLAHHTTPRRTIGLPFFVAFALACTLFAACRLVLPRPYPYYFVTGAYAGWLAYGVLHHVEHVTDLALPRYRRLRRHHFMHHAAMSTNFGVSTTLWDRVFGTFEARHSRPRHIAS